MSGDVLLQIDSLRIGLRKGPSSDLVRGVSMTIRPGERVGLVGESGSGKSLLSLSVMGLLPSSIAVRSGTISIAGERIDDLPKARLATLRGRRMAMIYQNPLNSLNPLMRVGDQIAEAIVVHNRVSRSAASARAIQLLDRVGVREPAVSARCYPHEFSGGMRQRAMIAMAISCEPELLLADEPTTALDVTTQAKMLDLLHELSVERAMAVLFVTHNLAVANRFCDRVDVMYRGEIVESGRTADVLGTPAHPYTRALRDSLCTFDTDPNKRLYQTAPEAEATSVGFERGGAV
jgi:ABC-type dipeptide/oligopeptide/nickel transport system ATPase component